jgi:hypothetical protein
MAYAFIDEVWAVPTKSNAQKKSYMKQEPACNLYKRRDGKERPLDDIMNAYMDEAPYDKYERASNELHRVKKRERALKSVDIKPQNNKYDVSDEFVEDEMPGSKCYNGDQIEGIKGKSILNSYDYDKYYNDNIIQDEEQYEENDACIDEHLLEEESPNISKSSFKKNDIYNDIILEKYVNAMNAKGDRPTSQKMYMDLVLYVGSGILLIFMMEQIIQLGLLLR